MISYRFHIYLFPIVIVLLLTKCTKENNEMNSDAVDEIKGVIKTAYIDGIHGDQDINRINTGFHPEFSMLVYNSDQIEKVNVEEWLVRIDKMKSENPEMWNSETTYTFESVDVSGNAASAKLNVYKGRTHFSTDYMLLYKFEDGWKIVSKIFSIPSG